MKKSKKDTKTPAIYGCSDPKIGALKEVVERACSGFIDSEQKQRLEKVFELVSSTFTFNHGAAMAILYQFLCTLQIPVDDKNFNLFPEIKREMEILAV